MGGGFERLKRVSSLFGGDGSERDRKFLRAHVTEGALKLHLHHCLGLLPDYGRVVLQRLLLLLHQHDQLASVHAGWSHSGGVRHVEAVRRLDARHATAQVPAAKTLR